MNFEEITFRAGSYLRKVDDVFNGSMIVVISKLDIVPDKVR